MFCAMRLLLKLIAFQHMCRFLHQRRHKHPTIGMTVLLYSISTRVQSRITHSHHHHGHSPSARGPKNNVARRSFLKRKRFWKQNLEGPVI